METLQSYAEGTASSLLALSLESLGLKDVKAYHAAYHLGINKQINK